MDECPKPLGRTTTDYLKRNKIFRKFCDGIMHGVVKARPNPYGDSQESRFEVYFLGWCPKHGTNAQRVQHFQKPMTLETFESNRQPVAYDAAVAFVTNFPNCGNVVFSGTNGAGKTHLATAIYERLKQKHNAEFVTWRDLRDVFLQKRPAHDSLDDREISRGRYRQFIRSDLLVIDDFGQRMDGDTEFILDCFAGMLDELNGRLVMTTNRSWKEIESMMGRTIADRLSMNMAFVAMAGQSYRRGGVA